MKTLKFLLLGILSFASICYAQIDTTKMENFLSADRRDFIHSLSANLTVDDETTILRAHLMRLVLCKIKSDAAEQFCKDLKASEDLTGQNVELQDFALSTKNLRLVLNGLTAVYRGVQSYAIGADAKKQISELLPLMAFALAKVDKPIEASAYAIAEIQKRHEVAKAFSENMDLRVYELFLRNVLYWLRGTEPDGRPEPWEIAGSQVVEQNNYGCRIRRSGKFQCWKKQGNARIDFPMETEEGYKLKIYPHSYSESMAICSQGPELKAHCWLGNPTPDGYEIEKCAGEFKNLLWTATQGVFGHDSQWAEGLRFVKLSCEKSGPRVLGYRPADEDDRKAMAINVAADISEERFISFDGSEVPSAFFLNYVCNIKNKILACQQIPNFEAKELQLWRLDPSTKIPRDGGTKNLFFGFDRMTDVSSVFAIADGMCYTLQDRTGFMCRHFVIEGDKALALDFYSEAIDHSMTSASHNFSFRPVMSDAILKNRLPLQHWRFDKEGEAYRLKQENFVFTGGIPDDRYLSFEDYFPEERIVCFSSLRKKGLRDIDYDDPDYNSGANRRCVHLDNDNNPDHDVETAMPFNRPNQRLTKIGRALCITANDKIVCDFPATTRRLFEQPVLTMNFKSSFNDTTGGYLCSAESDSALCYNLMEPGTFESLKKYRFRYKAHTKEMMLTRDMKIRALDAAADLYMCSVYTYAEKDGTYIHTCESAGNDAKIVQFVESYKTEPYPYAPVAKVKRSPAPKKKRSKGPAITFAPRPAKFYGTQPARFYNFGRY